MKEKEGFAWLQLILLFLLVCIVVYLVINVQRSEMKPMHDYCNSKGLGDMKHVKSSDAGYGFKFICEKSIEIYEAYYTWDCEKYDVFGECAMRERKLEVRDGE